MQDRLFIYLLPRVFSTADHHDFAVILQNYFDDWELFGEGGGDNVIIVLTKCFIVLYQELSASLVLWNSICSAWGFMPQRIIPLEWCWILMKLLLLQDKTKMRTVKCVQTTLNRVTRKVISLPSHPKASSVMHKSSWQRFSWAVFIGS